MRVVLRVSVAFDAESYQQAGEILDRIDAKVGKALAGRGHHDITSFETRPCKAARFDENVGMMRQPDADMPEAMPGGFS